MLPAIRDRVVVETIQNVPRTVVGNLGNVLTHDEKKRTVLFMIVYFQGKHTVKQHKPIYTCPPADTKLIVNDEAPFVRMASLALPGRRQSTAKTDCAAVRASTAVVQCSMKSHSLARSVARQ
jgi:hypothetical protein